MLPKLNTDFSLKDVDRRHPNGVKHEGKTGGNEGIQTAL